VFTDNQRTTLPELAPGGSDSLNIQLTGVGLLEIDVEVDTPCITSPCEAQPVIRATLSGSR
jgi:hypothetical protein